MVAADETRVPKRSCGKSGRCQVFGSADEFAITAHRSFTAAARKHGRGSETQSRLGNELRLPTRAGNADAELLHARL